MGKPQGVTDAGLLKGAGIQAGGSLVSSGVNIYEAHKNRKFQREMANTAHFREMRDLKRSGLNPILSVTGGPGSATPSGATARTTNPLEGVNPLTKSQSQLASAQISKANQETATSKKLGGLYSAQSAEIWSKMPLTELKGNLVKGLVEPFEGGFDVLRNFGRDTGVKLSQEHTKYKKWHKYLNDPIKNFRQKIQKKFKKYYKIKK